jgi:phage terminase large subunit-like protein
VDFVEGLQKIILPEISRWVAPSDLINGAWEDSYSKAERILTLNNGSTCDFLTYEQDKNKHSGTSRHFVWFDEEPTEDVFNEDLARLVDTDGDWYLTLTPLHGLTHLYYTYYEPIVINGDLLPSTEVFLVDSRENPYIKAEALEELFANMSSEERDARLTGRFLTFSGLIYPEFSDAHIIDPIDVSQVRENLIICAMDHGGTNPTAWLWASIDSDGRCIIFHEYYQPGEIVSYHAQQVRLYNSVNSLIPAYNIGDPAIKQKNPLDGSSVQQEYAINGIGIALANNKHDIGFDRVRWYLKHNKLYITKNCTNLIRELRGYRYKSFSSSKMGNTRNPLEEPMKKNDHACDALRYLLVSRPENDTGSEVTPQWHAPFQVSPTLPLNDVVHEYDYYPPHSDERYHVILGDEW